MWCNFAKAHGKSQGSISKSTKNTCTRHLRCKEILGSTFKTIGMPDNRAIIGIIVDNGVQSDIINIEDDQNYFYINIFGEHQNDGLGHCTSKRKLIAMRYKFSEQEIQIISENLLSHGGTNGIRQLWDTQRGKTINCSYRQLQRKVQSLTKILFNDSILMAKYAEENDLYYQPNIENGVLISFGIANKKHIELFNQCPNCIIADFTFSKLQNINYQILNFCSLLDSKMVFLIDNNDDNNNEVIVSVQLQENGQNYLGQCQKFNKTKLIEKQISCQCAVFLLTNIACGHMIAALQYISDQQAIQNNLPCKKLQYSDLRNFIDSKYSVKTMYKRLKVLKIPGLQQECSFNTNEFVKNTTTVITNDQTITNESQNQQMTINDCEPSQLSVSDEFDPCQILQNETIKLIRTIQDETALKEILYYINNSIKKLSFKIDNKFGNTKGSKIRKRPLNERKRGVQNKYRKVQQVINSKKQNKQ
ncbi:SWIM-type [Hexamita inflata]|uniref:SWIM-type n=1 Tax=Hexamita inflata TaxID=28002 RepID=A0AA86THC0_9EUKA|nr:SWIM-type [Hexamita inflata]